MNSEVSYNQREFSGKNVGQNLLNVYGTSDQLKDAY